MLANWLSLVEVGYCKYKFEDTIPGEYTIRLEFLDNAPNDTESTQYIKFLEDTGAEYLGSVMRWVYFRRKNELGEFDIYSDLDSRIKHLDRILKLVGIIGDFNLFNAFNMMNLSLQSNVQFSISLSILAFIVSLLCGVGFVKILNIKKKLLKDKHLFE